MLTDTGQGLLDAILDDPADDAVRLVFADFLEEQGDVGRAEFIRVQVELAGTPEIEEESIGEAAHRLAGTPFGAVLAASAGSAYIPADFKVHRPNPRHEELCSRERELLAANRGAWTGPAMRAILVDHIAERTLYGNRTLPEYPYVFRRGFVAEIACTCADFMAHAGVLFMAHPVEKVTLTDREPVQIGRGCRFMSGGIHVSQERSMLPIALWDALGEVMRKWPDEPSCYHHIAREELAKYLSAACVAHGANERRRLRRQREEGES